MTVEIVVGDWIESLRQLPSNSVQCVVTSPPYWAQRDYQVDGQLGREPSLMEHLEALVAGFREVRRVLRPDGVCWVNYGDAWATKGYTAKPAKDAADKPANWSSDRRGQSVLSTVGGEIKEKDLIGAPWALAFALRADGWWLRDCIIWNKPNPSPSSVPDRTCPAHEYVFMFSKSARYFYDGLAIEEPLAESSKQRYAQPTLEGQTGGDKQVAWKENAGSRANSRSPADLVKAMAASGKTTRKKRSVWVVPVLGFDEAHFATYPTELIEPCILAATSEKGCCSACGAPWERQVERTSMVIERSTSRAHLGNHQPSGKMVSPPTAKTIGWAPGCACEAPVVPCRVLDPFGGAGTTGLVADRLGRDAVLLELNPEYAAIAQRRIKSEMAEVISTVDDSVGLAPLPLFAL